MPEETAIRVRSLLCDKVSAGKKNAVTKNATADNMIVLLAERMSQRHPSDSTESTEKK